MDPNFFVQVKYTMFGLNRGLRVHLDLFAPDVSKSTFFASVLFSTKHPILEAFWFKNHSNHVKTIVAKENIYIILKLHSPYKF